MENMNGIHLFKNPQFGEVRAASNENGEPMFCLADVARILELSPSKVAQRLSDDVLSKYPIVDNLGRSQLANFVNEDGLYDAILNSRIPGAKAFRKWVTSEILPSIRKTGAYMTDAVIERTLQDPDYLIQLATTIKVERQKRKEEEQKRLAAEEAIKLNEPKVNFANAIIASKTSCLIGELAKILTQNGYEIGQNRLFEWMRSNGYLGTSGERRNIPNQKYVEMGLFKLKKGTRSGNDGVLYTTITPKVTTKGQEYFINKILPTCKRIKD